MAKTEYSYMQDCRIVGDFDLRSESVSAREPQTRETLSPSARPCVICFPSRLPASCALLSDPVDV